MIDMRNKVLAVSAGIALIVLASFIVFKAAVKPRGPSSAVPGLKSITDIVQKSVNPAREDADIKRSEEIIAKDPASPKAEDEFWHLAAIYERRQDLLKMKEVYQNIIEKFPSSRNVPKAQEALESTNIKLVFSDINTPDSFIYVVQKGDSLDKIARKFTTTVEMIMQANGLKAGILRAGKKLKITKLKFTIAVDKSQNILTLKSDGNVFKTYRVSTGKDSCTPVGTFKIITKIVDPPWYPSKGKMIPSGDPKNVLGSRWLGISKPSYGIHGTIDPGNIGKSVTEGCVRMKNEEVEELYKIVPIGTEVVIVD